MTNRFYSLLILCLLLFVVSACDFAQPVPTPIMVTATPEFLIVTSTPLPTTTQVLLPTLPAEEIGLNLTATPTLAPTQRITNTPTFTPTPTDTPATPGAIIGLVGGGSVGGASIVCTSNPQGGFGSIYSGNPQIATQLGCPIGGAVPINNAYQTHERGAMIWISSLGESPQEVIYAIGNNGTYQRYNDTWLEGVEPEITGLTPPQAGLMEPKRGFGKVWREAAGVRDNIGWATSGENGGSGIIQLFERGEMLYVPQSGQTYVLITGGTWSSVAQPY